MTRKERIEQESAINAAYVGGLEIVGKFSKEKLQTYQNGFVNGAEWADKNPALPWISVEEDLPCNHEEIIYPLSCGSIKFTQAMIVQDENGKIDISSMCCQDDDWIWVLNEKWKYWMPISALETFTHK